MAMETCLRVLRGISQVLLIIVNIVVALLGLAVMILGAWAKATSTTFFEIAADNSQFTSVSVLLIIIGIFVLIVGAIGTVGAVFANTVFGRITLGLYAVVLGLLVICEIAGGIAAGVERNSLDNAFHESANLTFQQYNKDANVNSTWDNFQQTFDCCGVNSWMDYQSVLGQVGVVPQSCCNSTTVKQQECAQIHTHVNESVVDDEYKIYNQGCVAAVLDGIQHYLGAIAGGAIVIGLIQIFGIVLACFVAIYKRQENKYEVV